MQTATPQTTNRPDMSYDPALLVHPEVCLRPWHELRETHCLCKT